MLHGSHPWMWVMHLYLQERHLLCVMRSLRMSGTRLTALITLALSKLGAEWRMIQLPAKQRMHLQDLQTEAVMAAVSSSMIISNSPMCPM